MIIVFIKFILCCLYIYGDFNFRYAMIWNKLQIKKKYNYMLRFHYIPERLIRYSVVLLYCKEIRLAQVCSD